MFSTPAKEPTESDWAKLIRIMMKYLHSTWWYVLTITAKDITVTKWMVNPSSAVYPDFKSHTGATLLFGGLSIGSVVSVSRKQKRNAKSSTQAELALILWTILLWTMLFIEAQGYLIWIDCNILYQDNKSAISLQQNNKKCSSKRTRHLNIGYFFLTDQQENGNIEIAYCPTDAMISDCMCGPKPGQQNGKIAWERWP